MKNKNNLQLSPNLSYWESIFSSFVKLKIFDKLKKQESLYSEIINKENSLVNLIYNLSPEEMTIKNCALKFQEIIISKNEENLTNNYQEIFKYLFDELHNELKYMNNDDKNEENKENMEDEEKDENSPEIINREFNDDKQAFEFFKEYIKKNKSFIQKLFF